MKKAYRFFFASLLFMLACRIPPRLANIRAQRILSLVIVGLYLLALVLIQRRPRR